jgi:RNA polymerase sigma factor (sigma-70 family)
MADNVSDYVHMVQLCQSIIVRIRARPLRAAPSEEDWNDLLQIYGSVTPVLMIEARKLGTISATAREAALEAMLDQLRRDVFSRSFPSLETRFGAYLRTMPIRVRQQIRRKFVLGDALLMVESLDQAANEEGLALHETLADPNASTPFEAIGDREAIEQALMHLPVEEQLVVRLWLQGFKNNEIAQQFSISAPKATRIRQRAFERLKRLLVDTEE